MPTPKWIRMSDNRLVNSKMIGECSVLQVLPEYGWWVKCTARDLNKIKYWIHSEWSNKNDAIKALEEIYNDK